MEDFWQTISGTHWGVYVLFIYLLGIGIRATKHRIVPIKRVVLLPLLFISWSLYDLYKNLGLGLLSMIPLWMVFLAIGVFLGVKEVHSWHFHKNHHKKEITIPGNYSTLVLILLFFILKFFWSYFYATRIEVSYWIFFVDTATSSLITGFFVGRAGFFFKIYHKH